MEPKANPAAKAAAAQTENAAAQTEAKAKAAAAAAVPTVACCLVVKHEDGQALTPPQADSFDPEDSRQVNFQQLLLKKFGNLPIMLIKSAEHEECADPRHSCVQYRLCIRLSCIFYTWIYVVRRPSHMLFSPPPHN
jgi:hypothetical protein